MNKYLVALSVGGIMEQPEITYQDYQIIEANNKDEAVKKYNQINNCSFFYGSCILEIVNGEVNVLNENVSYKAADTCETSTIESLVIPTENNIKEKIEKRLKELREEYKKCVGAKYWIQPTNGPTQRQIIEKCEALITELEILLNS